MRTLLPREHGAYAQMAFPLVTALVTCGTSLAAMAWTTFVAAAFVMHEPMFVALGRRGRRLHRERGRHARLATVVIAALATVSLVFAIAAAPAGIRWTAVVPAVPALVVAIAIAADREKSAAGELAVAVTFSAAALPAATFAGGPVTAGLVIATTFALVFAAAVLAVRTVVLGMRAGGAPQAVRATSTVIRWGAPVAAFGVWAALGHHVSPWILPGAAGPALLFAEIVAHVRPSAARLRTLGWSIVGVSTFASVVLIAGL